MTPLMGFAPAADRWLASGHPGPGMDAPADLGLLASADGDIRVIDLHASNGTRVNGVRIDKASLDHGDLVEIGSSVMRCERHYSGTASTLQRGPADVQATHTAD